MTSRIPRRENEKQQVKKKKKKKSEVWVEGEEAAIFMKSAGAGGTRW